MNEATPTPQRGLRIVRGWQPWSQSWSSKPDGKARARRQFQIVGRAGKRPQPVLNRSKQDGSLLHHCCFAVLESKVRMLPLGKRQKLQMLVLETKLAPSAPGQGWGLGARWFHTVFSPWVYVWFSIVPFYTKQF